ARARSPRTSDRWWASSSGRSPQIGVGDDALLDLGGALEDLGQARVPPVALERELARVAGAAVDLDALAGHLLGHLAREELRHRRLDVDPLPAVRGVGGGVGERPRGLDLGQIGRAYV